jgi:hypothetical protein
LSPHLLSPKCRSSNNIRPRVHGPRPWNLVHLVLIPLIWSCSFSVHQRLVHVRLRISIAYAKTS